MLQVQLPLWTPELLHNNLRQVVHILVPLSSSSVSWYQCKNQKGNGRLWKECGLPSVTLSVSSLPARDHETGMSTVALCFTMLTRCVVADLPLLYILWFHWYCEYVLTNSIVAPPRVLLLVVMHEIAQSVDCYCCRRLLYTTDPRCPKAKLSGNVPSLVLHISEKKVCQ